MQPITIENVKIGFRNFSGKPGKFNQEGDRNFVLFIDDTLAKKLEADGWNVRWLKPRTDDVEPQAILQIKVMFGQIPPSIILVGNKGRTLLNEDNINILDWADIDTVDVIIRPYEWTVSGKSGVKAYLKKMYVTLIEDELERKYEVVPDTAQDAIGGCGDCKICDGKCGEIL